MRAEITEANDLRRAMATFKYTQGMGVYRDRLVEGMTRRGCPHVVPTAGVAQQVVEQVANAGAVPEVVVGVYDRQVEVERPPPAAAPAVLPHR